MEVTDGDAEDQEVIERQNLAEAMAASLIEEETRKSEVKPLRLWSSGALLDRFKSSIVLKQLAQKESIFDLPCRTELLEVLEFERQARAWFPGPGTLQYFANAVEAASCSAPQTSKMPETIPTGRGGRNSRKRPIAMQPQRLDVQETLAALHKKVLDAKECVFSMPDTDNEVPSIFRGSGATPDADSDVEIIECDEPSNFQPIQILT